MFKVLIDKRFLIEIIQNDLTEEEYDAITNAANSKLKHGGGLAGAIVQKGGEQIQKESDLYVETHGPILVGASCHTSAGNLPCKHIIHTVGPMYNNYP